MQARQDRYTEAMRPFQLERGVRNSGATHENAREYYARMELAIKTANKGEIRANKGLFGSYTRESVVELEKSAKSLKTAFVKKSMDLRKKAHELSVELRLDLETKARQIGGKGAKTESIGMVDEAVRKHMGKLNPWLNPWETIDRYGGGRREEIEKDLHERFQKTQSNEEKRIKKLENNEPKRLARSLKKL